MGDAEGAGIPARKHKRSEKRHRSAQVAVRLSPGEQAVLFLAAKQAGKSLPALLRETALASIKVEGGDDD
jgi:predicted HicB family RNase H-like nuclease